MTKIISYSLWGDNPKYCVGAIKNADLAFTIYPDWLCRFYVGQSVPVSIKKELWEKPNVEIVEMSNDGNWNGMFWRFYPASESSVDVMISRDCDSRLTEREKSAVDEWLKSDKMFHIMRDHPYHTTAILGGMWGAKKGAIPNFYELLESRNRADFWQVDQIFLRDVIYPIIKDTALVHDEFFSGSPFPTKRNEKYEFVGEVLDQNDNRNEDHVNIIKKYYETSRSIYTKF